MASSKAVLNVALWLVLGVIAAVFVVGVVESQDGGKPTESPHESEPAPAAKAPEAPPPAGAPAVEITALQLFDDYRGNEVGADAKYKGRALRVSGIVDHVSHEGREGAFVDFVVHGGERVQAHFVDGADVVAVTHADLATVRCYGDGQFGGPQLKDCALEVAPAPK